MPHGSPQFIILQFRHHGLSHSPRNNLLNRFLDLVSKFVFTSKGLGVGVFLQERVDLGVKKILVWTNRRRICGHRSVSVGSRDLAAKIRVWAPLHFGFILLDGS